MTARIAINGFGVVLDWFTSGSLKELIFGDKKHGQETNRGQNSQNCNSYLPSLPFKRQTKANSHNRCMTSQYQVFS